jgi:hypothetical protein
MEKDIMCGLKWVLQGKKLERKKIMVEYLSFQGGDLLPLAQYYSTTAHSYPSPLNTSATDHLDPLPSGVPHSGC